MVEDKKGTENQEDMLFDWISRMAAFWKPVRGLLNFSHEIVYCESGDGDPIGYIALPWICRRGRDGGNVDVDFISRRMAVYQPILAHRKLDHACHTKPET